MGSASFNQLNIITSSKEQQNKSAMKPVKSEIVPG